MSGFRRTWDKELYAAKAQDRLENGDEAVDPQPVTSKRPKREEFIPASDEAEGPMGSQRAFIQSRKDRIDVDSKVGKTEVIDPTNVEKGAGFWCEVCACLLKDSASYLDHVNGKRRK